jgi:capsid assembly protease
MARDALTRSAHVLDFALSHPWAMAPEMLPVIATVLARHLAGDAIDDDELAAVLMARDTRAVARDRHTTAGDSVAVIPLYGVVAPRMNLVSEMSGGTTFETLTAQLRDAVAAPQVTRIVFDVDSPGGNVAGASEFAREVRQAATQKPVVAVAQYQMASAAYWVMAGATELVGAPSAMIGSVGVYSIHNDISEALAKMGIKRTVIAAGKYKAEGADGGPLSADAHAHVKGLVDTSYGRFVADVARGRQVPVTTVKSGFGEGRALDAEAALAAGMITRIGTLDEVLRTDGAARSTTTVDPHRQAAARAAMAHRHALVVARAPQIVLT